MEKLLTVNVDEVMVLIGGLFAAYYLVIEIMNWFETITNQFKKEELVFAGAINNPKETIKLEEIIMTEEDKKGLEKIEELKEEIIEQVSVKFPLGQNPQMFNEHNSYERAGTPDLSNIKLPGLSTKVDRVVNL